MPPTPASTLGGDGPGAGPWAWVLNPVKQGAAFSPSAGRTRDQPRDLHASASFLVSKVGITSLEGSGWGLGRLCVYVWALLSPSGGHGLGKTG